MYYISYGFIYHKELVLQYKFATQLFSIRLFLSKPGFLPNAFWLRPRSSVGIQR